MALKILENNIFLATMADEKGFGTALHLLAQHDISDISACREAILEGIVTMFAALPCRSCKDHRNVSHFLHNQAFSWYLHQQWH